MSDPAFEGLLEHIRVSRGFDFTGYKRASLRRRIEKRMEEVEVADVVEYTEYLELHPEEFPQLFNTICINVTALFRDPPAWEHLRRSALPAMLSRKGDVEPVRVWSAGTASGEEAYSLAILLADALGDEVYRERVKIYATDVDVDALADARHAVYDAKAAENVPPDLAERYLLRTDGRFTLAPELRRNVIFGRNDLIQDAPISRIDLLACRNVLMYFNAETQGRILGRLNFALNDTGVLFLGKSELLVTRSALFTPDDVKCRTFRKVPAPGGRRLPFPSPAGNGRDSRGGAQSAATEAAQDSAWLLGSVPEVVVAPDGRLALANDAACELFGLRKQDLGRRFSDLELSYRPVELRSAIEQATTERAPVAFTGVSWSRAAGDERRLDIRVLPLSGELGVAVSFRDVTSEGKLKDDLERSRRELETAYEELQSTVEELETTNEELQSTNEELETTNEELQSTNEELETMNEELQSTNEELETMNDELRRRTDELHGANAFLETVLLSLELGVVAVDREGVVRMWNERSEELWGLREQEVLDRHLLGLDIGLPVDRLGPPVREILAGGRDELALELDATNRRGRTISVGVTARPLRDVEGAISGVILLVGETPAEDSPQRAGSDPG